MKTRSMINILIVGLTTVLALTVINKSDFRKQAVQYYKLKN